MRVSFNEEANVCIHDDLTSHQRKDLWYSHRHWQDSVREFEHDVHNAFPVPSMVGVIVGDDGDDDDEFDVIRKERRERIRLFVRFVVEEYKLLKAMGMDDAISLYRISVACTKVDATKARERAADGKQLVKSSCCSSLLRKRHCSAKQQHTITEQPSQPRLRPCTATNAAS